MLWIPFIPSLIAIPQSYDLILSKFTASPDGFSTQVLGVNSEMMFPIILDKGQQVAINVTNAMDEASTLHFHGIFQNGTNYYDGPAGVTQCGIKPGSSLVYKFSVDHQRGTYWYHSHHKSQYVKGIRGPLIIRDLKNDPYLHDYDEEYIVMLTEWYHARNPEDLLNPFLSANNSAGAEPVPESVLINGRGRVDCTKVKGECTQNAPWTRFSFTPKKRIINGAAMASFNFSIDGHTLDIIEADGVETRRTTVDKLRIAVDSVIVTANAKPNNYWVRATMDTSLWTNFASDVLDPQGKAVIHYNSMPEEDPKSADNAVSMLDPFTLMSLSPEPAPESTVIFGVMFAIVPDEFNQSRAYVGVDGVFDPFQYNLTTENPLLFSIMKKEPVPTSANAVEVEKGDIVDVTIYNDDAMPHAFHLHGHRFWVIKHGHTIPFRAQPDTRWSKSRKRSLHQDMDPTTYPMRDSIEIPPCVIRNSGAGEGGICGGTKGYAVIRFVADNPGIWLLHCHMEWHFGQGLAMTWIEGKDQLQKIGYNGIPQEVRDTCSMHSSK